MRRYLSLICLLLPLLASCEGCRERAPESLLELVAPTAAVIHVPDLAKLSRGAEGFTGRLIRKAGDLGPKLKQTIRDQAGFDPLDPEQWSKAGIDPSGGLVMFTEGTVPVSIVAVKVTEKERFDKAVAAFIKHVDGADRLHEEEVHGVTLRTIGRPFGEELVAVAHWVHLPGVALLTQASGKESLLAALQRLRAPAPPEGRPSLAKDAAYAAAIKKVPDGVLTFRALAQTAAMMSMPAESPIQQMVASLQMSAQGLSGESFLFMSTEGLQGALGDQPVLATTSRVPGDAVILMATHGAQSKGLQTLRSIAPLQNYIQQTLDRIEHTSGVPVEKEALPHFAGPLTLSVHLHDLPSLPQRLQTRNLAVILDVIHVAITASLKDAKAMQDVLAKAQTTLAGQGVTLRQRTKDVGGATAVIYEPDRPDAKFAWGVWKDLYLYAAGSGRMDKVLEQLAQGDSPVPKELEAGAAGRLAGEAGAAVLVVRGSKIAEAAGQAQLGAAATMMLGSLLDLVKTTGDIAISLRPEQEGLRIKLNQVIQ